MLLLAKRGGVPVLSRPSSQRVGQGVRRRLVEPSLEGRDGHADVEFAAEEGAGTDDDGFARDDFAVVCRW